MKRIAIQTFIAAGLVIGLGATTGCVKPPSKDGEGAAVATGGTLVTMDQVDASMNDKITGDRYQITYDEGDLWHGAPKGALVTIVEYSDFQCPYCVRLADSLKDVAAEYPDDVRVVFKHFPLPMHDRAKPASEAVLAANAQGKGWEMHDLVFENNRKLTTEDLVRYAEEVKVADIAKFKADLESQKYAAQVEADKAEGRKFGVGSTPSFFVNGTPHRGAKSTEQLKKLIEKEKKFAQSLIDAGAKRSEIYARIMKAAKTKRASKRPTRKKAQTPRPGKPDPSVNYAVPAADRPQKGSDEALVTIVEYSDFQCPYCRKVLPTLEAMEKKYGEKLRIVFRQQPLGMHKQAKPAAYAALAAHKQGKFWEMHDALFAKAASRKLNDGAYVEIAKQLGLDIDKFNADRASPEIAKMVEEDQAIAKQFGAGGTPAFFVNGRPLSGARPAEAFSAVIDEEIAKAEAFMAKNKVEPKDLYAEMLKTWETEVKAPPIADHVRRDIPTEGLAGRGNLKNPEITLIECSDFDCPYCKRGAELVEQIFASPKYKDKVAFYFAHFPLPMHKNAESAHRAAEAAGIQGKFFEMHDLLFADRTKRSETDYRAMATKIGLDVDKFITDWKSEAVKQKVLDNKALCSKNGVSGTPNFFVNGRAMRGAVPMKMASQVFDEELAGGFEAAAKNKAKGKKKPADKGAG